MRIRYVRGTTNTAAAIRYVRTFVRMPLSLSLSLSMCVSLQHSDNYSATKFNRDMSRLCYEHDVRPSVRLSVTLVDCKRCNKE